MSVADRMVVRTLSGAYRSLPRRQALGLIAAGRVTPEAAPVTPEPVSVTLEQAREQLAHAMGLPVEAITSTDPADDPYGTHAAQGESMMQALAADAEPDPIPADIPARELPPEPKSTARRAEWADYADSLGVQVTSTMTKTQIQVAAQEAAQSLSNLPQPALTGGRLETPEDEPAAETVADDPDTRTR